MYTQIVEKIKGLRKFNYTTVCLNFISDASELIPGVRNWKILIDTLTFFNNNLHSQIFISVETSKLKILNKKRISPRLTSWQKKTIGWEKDVRNRIN